MRPRGIAACVAVFTVFLARPAFAYVDPGTGSMIVQMLVAGVAAGFTTIALYWSRLKSWLRGSKNGNSSTSDDE